MPETVVNFYWLHELFDAKGWGGRYADRALKDITPDARQAHWFASKEEACGLLDKAPKAEGEWRATEHGFTE